MDHGSIGRRPINNRFSPKAYILDSKGFGENQINNL